jgi:hypothetical protein
MTALVAAERTRAGGTVAAPLPITERGHRAASDGRSVTLLRWGA